MTKILIVIDMQNDFIDGSLGTKEGSKRIRSFIKLRASANRRSVS